MSPKVFIESLNLQAQGVGRLTQEDGTKGKVVFVDGALPLETVSYRSKKVKNKFEMGELGEIYRPSPFRVNPPCDHYGICGGCSMQHFDSRAQVSLKQRALEDVFRVIGKIKPDQIISPIVGPAWGYRYRGRLSVFRIPKGRLIIGFHQKKSSLITDMSSCEILPPKVSDLIPYWRDLIASLSIADRIPQLEFAVGEGIEVGRIVYVFVIRHLADFSKDDLNLIKEFAITHAIDIWLQSKGPDSAMPFYPEDSFLCYRLPEYSVEVPFRPTDFTQVNHQMNRVLVSKALRELQPLPTDHVLDLFCGIGNFTLPLARHAQSVLGVEGSETLTHRAMENAEHNQLQDKVRFMCSNLFEVDVNTIRSWGKFNKWLIDPPRDGAIQVVNALAKLAQSQDGSDQEYLPNHIVYVSCSPSTLARDAAVLAHVAGYRLRKTGVANMFPHTSHVESIAVFER